MKIIIAGGGETGVELARSLIAEKHEVVVIEKDKKRAEEIAETLDCLVVNANAAHPQTLKDVGVEDADVLVAMTGNDRDNILVALLAKQFEAENIIVKIDDPVFNDILLYMGIDKIVNPGRLVAAQILSMIKGFDIISLSSIIRGDIRLLNITITDRFDNRKIADLPIDKDKAYPLLLYRGERIIFPYPDTLLQKGDILLVASRPEYLKKLQTLAEE